MIRVTCDNIACGSSIQPGQAVRLIFPPLGHDWCAPPDERTEYEFCCWTCLVAHVVDAEARFGRRLVEAPPPERKR